MKMYVLEGRSVWYHPVFSKELKEGRKVLFEGTFSECDDFLDGYYSAFPWE